jgi:hypothetical protein
VRRGPGPRTAARVSSLRDAKTSPSVTPVRRCTWSHDGDLINDASASHGTAPGLPPHREAIAPEDLLRPLAGVCKYPNASWEAWAGNPGHASHSGPYATSPSCLMLFNSARTSRRRASLGRNSGRAWWRSYCPSAARSICLHVGDNGRCASRALGTSSRCEFALRIGAPGAWVSAWGCSSGWLGGAGKVGNILGWVDSIYRPSVDPTADPGWPKAVGSGLGNWHTEARARCSAGLLSFESAPVRTVPLPAHPKTPAGADPRT